MSKFSCYFQLGYVNLNLITKHLSLFLLKTWQYKLVSKKSENSFQLDWPQKVEDLQTGPKAWTSYSWKYSDDFAPPLAASFPSPEKIMQI